MEKILAYLTPVIVYAFIFLLNVIMPGRWVTGYATKTGTDEKLRYRLNGLLVLITSIICWVLLCHYAVLPWDWLYTYRWEGLIGAVAFGLIFSWFFWNFKSSFFS